MWSHNGEYDGQYSCVCVGTRGEAEEYQETTTLLRYVHLVSCHNIVGESVRNMHTDALRRIALWDKSCKFAVYLIAYDILGIKLFFILFVILPVASKIL